jgi:glyoxylase-like metal-dependent hydrolase (beta-lactamase superfamily II)
LHNTLPVSSDAPSEPYSVQVFRGGGEYGPAVSLCWNERLTEFAELYYYLVLVRNSTQTILINTGMPEDFSAFEKFVQAWHPSCRLFREEDETPNAVLARAGVTPEQVDVVILTPLTIYSTGNLHLFPRAQFAMNRRGWIDFWAPDKYAPKLPPDIAIPRESRAYLAAEAMDRIRLLDDEDTIAPGVTCFHTGGHHTSSMAICVATKKGNVVIGDCFFTYENLDRNVPIGWAENLHEIYAAYNRVRREADIAIPLYDPEVLKRFPDGVVA